MRDVTLNEVNILIQRWCTLRTSIKSYGRSKRDELTHKANQNLDPIRGGKIMRENVDCQIHRFDDLPADMLRDSDGFRAAS